MPQSPQPPVIPVEDFFRNPEESSFRLSPDAEYIAFLRPWERRLNVHVRPRKGGEARRITSETERDISGIFWKGNARLLYLKDFGGDENYHLVAVDPDGGNLRDLTPFDRVQAGVLDELRDHPTDLIISLNRRDPEVFDAWRLNTVTGELRMVAENPGNITSWYTDHDGEIRLALTTDGVNSSLLYRAAAEQPFAPVLTTSFRDTLAPLFFTFDNQRVYALSNLGRDRTALIEMDPASGREVKLLFEHEEVDVEGLDYSPERRVLTEIEWTTWRAERQVLDPATAAIYQALEARLPGYQLLLQSHDRAEEYFIVASYNDRTLGRRWLYHAPSDELTLLAELAPWLQEEWLCEMQPISFTARDGLHLNGYLTLPQAGSAPWPVVLNPHGGPWARDVWGYNPEVQLLANRGFAVLQVNFRGSTGYGRRFWEASFGQWGLQMNDDLSDAVAWLVGEGVADPERVAIYGGSYGGYATLAGLAFSPELYACGVDYVGVSNLFTFLATIPPYWKPYLAMLHEMVGDPERDRERLTATSPVFHVERIRAPLLVAQGARDPRVNVEESNQIVAALRERGIEVPYLVKENEGHGFHNEENRFEFYAMMVEFLERHLGGRQGIEGVVGS